MSVIGKVSAIFTANSSGLVTGVNQAAASMRRMEGATASLRSGMNALVAIQGAQLFGSIASTASNYVRSLVSMGAAQAEVIDQQSKLAARVGMTYGEFAGLALAGDLAGVGMDTIAKAATKADIAFVKAQQGSKTAQAAFATLGLSMDEMAGMSASERFQAISSAIAALPTEAQRAAAATALFGKAGQELLPMFAGGAEGIAQAAEQAERLGLALTTAQGQDVEAMNDAFTLASKAIQGVVQQVTAYLAPAIKSIADTFTNMVGSIGGANIGRAIGDGILAGARFLAGIGDYIITNFSSVFSFLSSVGEQWGVVMDFAQRVGNFLYGVFKFFEAVGNSVGAAILYAASFFSSEAGKASKDYADSARANFAAAGGAMASAFTATSEPIGQAVAGPLTTALDAAVLQAQTSAAQIEESGKGAADAMAEQIAVAMEPQALKGVDSRSGEGIAEMFRLMRGTGQDVQQQQLGVLERIADTLDDQDTDYPFAIDGA
jgi:hypothetical protein